MESTLRSQTQAAHAMRSLLSSVHRVKTGVEVRTMRVWEEQHRRYFTAAAGEPLVVEPGQVVVMCVVDGWEDAPRAIEEINAALLPKSRGKK